MIWFSGTQKDFTYNHSALSSPSVLLYGQAPFKTLDREPRDNVRPRFVRITRAQGFCHEGTAEDNPVSNIRILSNTSVIGTEGMFHLFNHPLKEYYPTHQGAVR